MKQTILDALISDEQYSSQLPGLEHLLRSPRSLVPRFRCCVFFCDKLANVSFKYTGV